jgi:hypothetical protein
MPPSNAGYAYTAYGAAAAIYGVYAFSIWWRARRLAERQRAAAPASPEHR